MRNRSLLAHTISVCLLVLLLAVPMAWAKTVSFSMPRPAHASSVSRDAAAAGLAKAVRWYMGSQATAWGRTVETTCQAKNRTQFDCNWWIVAGRSGRSLRAARDGGGNGHLTPSRVRYRGEAIVTDRGKLGLRFTISY